MLERCNIKPASGEFFFPRNETKRNIPSLYLALAVIGKGKKKKINKNIAESNIAKVIPKV